ncbi:MAG: alpha/beta fold hydrolase [Saprospiraceae bacterium]
MNFITKILTAAFAALLFASCAKEQLMTEPGKLVPRTVDEDPSLPSIIVNGAMLHAEAFGHPDSTIIVCLHGGPGADYRYMLNCKDLAEEGYRVVFYDQRGSGLSQRFPKKSYTDLGIGALDLMYDELSGVITHYRTHADQKVFLLGHSWGAILATGYIGRYPNAIQGLVVCEPGGLVFSDIKEYITTSLSPSLWSEWSNDATYPDQFITGKEDQHEILDYKLSIQASYNPVTGEDNRKPGSFWRSGAVINTAMLDIGDQYKPDFSQGITSFNVPVLFFYSGNNHAYPDEWAARISSVFHQVDLIKVAGVGHDGIVSDDDAWRNITMPKVLSYFNSL